MSGSFVETMRMIKIEHSLFALPYALVSAFWAADGLPALKTMLLILLAMVSARSAAMAFNRYLDADIDALNPRTAIRSIPAGRLTRRFALLFTLANCLIFLLVCSLLNPLALALSPLMLVVLLGYSYTKRFTAYCHLVLGLALGLAPVGAWVAVRGSLAWQPVLLGLAVLLWTAGFDIIYACQDIAFDRTQGLKSIPARLGLTHSLRLSRFFHLLMLSTLVLLGQAQQASWPYWVGCAAVLICLIYEHSLVWNGDLTRVDMAFFTMNGAVSLLFGAFAILAVVL